ncbi:MAG: hypothetical protein ACREJP_05340, partial [Candidatus Methylomirabilales bacterium]
MLALLGGPAILLWAGHPPSLPQWSGWQEVRQALLGYELQPDLLARAAARLGWVLWTYLALAVLLRAAGWAAQRREHPRRSGLLRLTERAFGPLCGVVDLALAAVLAAGPRAAGAETAPRPPPPAASVVAAPE